MLGVTIDATQIKRMQSAIEGTGKVLAKELAAACNSTARLGVSIIAKEIGSELNVPQKAIKLSIKIRGKANRVTIRASVDVNKEGRINVGLFNGTYQKKEGISYKISKTQGRKTAKGAFLIKKYDGKAYKRKGKERWPITGIYAPSPWGVMTKGKKIEPSTEKIAVKLKEQIEKRIKYLLLKQSGAI